MEDNLINRNNNNNHSKKNNLAVNNEIREKEVRVIGNDGEPVGIMSGKDALALAEKDNLDLVMIAPQGTPPVCRVMDYGKYRFDQSKKEKDQRKNQQLMQLKEVRLSLNIDDHDFMTKVGHANKFLSAGDKVKVTIRFKGREVTHVDLGRKLMDKFKAACSEFGVFDEKPSKLEGRFYTTVISPKNEKSQTKQKNAKVGKENKETGRESGKELKEEQGVGELSSDS